MNNHTRHEGPWTTPLILTGAAATMLIGAFFGVNKLANDLHPSVPEMFGNIGTDNIVQTSTQPDISNKVDIPQSPSPTTLPENCLPVISGVCPR